MKKLLLATLAVAAMSAQAATVTSTFVVSVTLNARCTATNSGQTTLNFGTYDPLAAGAGASTPAPTVALTFDCTRGLAAPTVTFDAVSGVSTSTNPSYGVIAGLNYSVTAAPTTGFPTAGSAATAVSGGVGTAAQYSYTLTGAMAQGQAGACGGGTATACTPATSTVTRTMTLTY